MTDEEILEKKLHKKLKTVMDKISAVGPDQVSKEITKEALQSAKDKLRYLLGQTEYLTQEAMTEVGIEDAEMIASVVHDMVSMGFPTQLNRLLKSLGCKLLIYSCTTKEGCEIGINELGVSYRESNNTVFASGKE